VEILGLAPSGARDFLSLGDSCGVYHRRVDRVTACGVAAFVLAGGKSTRMGKNKAFLVLGDRTLLAHALELAGNVTRDVRIVGEANKFAAFGPTIQDVYRDRGPLGAIHAALLSTTAELNLMLAVDLPYLQPEFLQYLTCEAQRTSAVVTVARASGHLQPLCGVYRRAFVEAAERSLREGRNKIDRLFAAVETRVVSEAELSQAGFSGEIFRNLNTPEEWEEAMSKQG
jgi:molybdopterin-guanine dinucleotide biosynthesis protein A